MVWPEANLDGHSEGATGRPDPPLRAADKAIHGAAQPGPGTIETHQGMAAAGALALCRRRGGAGAIRNAVEEEFA